MLRVALVVALVAVPLVEIYALVQVGQVVGPLWTVAALLVVSLLGAALLRREGARTWRAFRTATTSGRVPAREVVDGALVLLAGALLLTPGFVTDAVGLLLLLPPVRAVVRRLLSGWVTRQLSAGLTGPGGPFLSPPGAGPSAGGRGSGRGSGRVVDGEVVDEP